MCTTNDTVPASLYGLRQFEVFELFFTFFKLQFAMPLGLVIITSLLRF